MLEDSFRWFGQTDIGVAMREATWGFAIVETVHLLGLAMLGGAVIAINFGAGRIRFRGVDAAAVARAGWPLLIGGLGVMIGSGVLLVASKPVRYYLDDMFRAKMALLLLAFLSSLAIRRALARRGGAPSPSLRLLAVASLALWLSVGVAGRLIGFL
jgi:hypothetical protein